MRRALLALLLAFTAAFTFVALDALRDGEDALIQRKYAEAIPHLQRALEEGKPEQRDRILLLLGRAQVLSGDVASGVQTFGEIAKQSPGSPLLRKSRFAAAEALALSKRFQEAAQVYREEIEKLIGLARTEEVAATYLGLAEQALQQERPDYARAVSFFDLAVDLGLSEAKERSVKLLAAEARLKEGNAQDAIVRFLPLTKSLEVQHGKLRAQLGLGRARLAAGDRPGARTALRDLLALDKTAPEAGDAAYEIALSYGVPNPAVAELDRAVGALADLAKGYPAHPKAKVAEYLIASCHSSLGRTEAALAALRSFLAAHGTDDLPEVPLARAGIGDVLRAQKRLPEAIEAWRSYLKAHPAHGEWERVQRGIVDAEFEIAWAAYEAGKEHFPRARELFDAFAKAYPIEPRNPDILATLGEMLVHEHKFEEAKDAFARCVSKYPNTEVSSRAQFRIAEIFEVHTFNYLEALRAYRKVTWGTKAAEAQQRIARLEKKHLHLLVGRTFRSGEKAAFQLTSRNMERVRVRVWRLDLETYFRAKHGIGAVDRLDIEVIAPDKDFESAVPEYRAYQETQRQVEIGWTEPGAYVVKVDDRTLEATALVLVTDLAVITKSSRHELLVFAQNQKENRVEPGTRVVISNGAKVLHEGTTDAEGCCRFQGPELQTAANLSVFAISPGGSGASSLDLSGLGYSPGLSAKGLLFTDRPGYLPGHLVHVKGIAREVEGGLYRMPQAQGYVAAILSPSGRPFLRREVTWSEFGTFAVDLPLPADAELGEWQVSLTRTPALAETFVTKFHVARFEQPRVSLAIEPKTPVVFRGERIQGRILAKYFFGEPVVGRDVRYALRLPDGGTLEAEGKTNAAGEVEFDFDTKEFGEEALAHLSATLVEENVATSLGVPVVTTEFVPRLSLVRPVYLSGETFDVKVAIADRTGKPLAKSGTMHLYRVELKGSASTEVLVDEKAFTSDAKDGAARATFTAKKGGAHLVRVTVKDRFGTLVTGQIGLTISGEDDLVKLRLLGERQSYRVGEVASVKVSNRVGKRLALRTLQGDGILECKAVLLEAGESTLELPLLAEHAPNFAVAFALIDGDRLYAAERELLVARDLVVTVKPMVEVAKPGDEVEVEVTTKDPKGAPVRAELALALVDESLYAVFADGTPKLGEHFWGKRRETAFRTTSSCTWKSEGHARPVDDAIAAEERAKIAFESNAWNAPLDLGGGGDGRFGVANRNSAEGPRTAGPGGPAGGRPAADPRAQAARARGGLGGAKPGDGTPIALPRVAGGAVSGSEEFSLGAPASERQPAGFDVFHVGNEVDANSRFRNLNLGFPTSTQTATGFADFSLATAAPRRDFSDLGAWLSALVTDEQGKARTKLKLPESTSGFRITVRGVTVETYVGEATGALRTQKPLQAAIVSPLALTEGDRTTISARAHNLQDETRSVALALETKVGSTATRGEASGETKGHQELEKSFPLVAAGADDVELVLRANAGPDADAVSRTIGVQPFGIEVRDGASGSTAESELVKLGLPAGREYTRLGLTVELGADPGFDLVNVALGSGYLPRSCYPVANTSPALASHGLAALLAWNHVESAGIATPADVKRLSAFVEGVLRQLASMQQKEGSFAWIGTQTADLRSTTQALAFFAVASKRGIPQAADLATRTAEWLLRQRPADTASRARIGLALALAARSRFEDLNTLHRGRANLDLEALARLALAWQQSRRTDLATELLQPLQQRLASEAAKDARSIEALALATLALAGIDARDPLVAKGIARIERARVGNSFGSAEASAAALWALVQAGGSKLARAARSEVAVHVNGKLLVNLPANAQQTQSTWSVPAADLKERDNEVEIRVTGQGTVRWSAVLSGFAKGFRPEDRRREFALLQRDYLPAPRRIDNHPVEPGFSVLTGEYQYFENKMTMLEAGKSGKVRGSFHLSHGLDTATTPFVVEEPIPAGCSVARDSIQGSYDHVEVAPDRLTFYVREGLGQASWTYELQARFPGTYQVLPTRVFGTQRPELVAHGMPSTFVVHPRGTPSTDAWRATPDELYKLGKTAFDKGDFEGAGAHLKPLFAEWKLRDDVHKDVVRMLLFVAIEAKDTAQIVRCFEELKDRFPDLVIPFDKIVAVGRAYYGQGEFERSLMVFRAAAEASFVKEAAVATTLQTSGETKASARFLRRLIESYPDLNTVRLSLYSLAQQEAALAASLKPEHPVQERVGHPTEIRRSALAGLREFLVNYPDDLLADEVSFAWATTLLEGKDVAGALGVADGALQRYPSSALQDELLYTKGYCLFAQGKHDEAFAVLDSVVKGSFPLPAGGKGESENKYHAIYLQGQIHHALGEPEKALACYQQVGNRFSDASEAAQYFLDKVLSLPEVTTIGLADKAEVPVAFRNVKQVEIKVYRVDLMRLYLLEKSLNDIRGIELHGIAPLATLQVALGEGRDYRMKEKKVELALEKPGAYLVVVRGSDLLATGMVLKSDLKIEAQETLDTGRMRVNVKRGEAFATSAQVKVIGAGGDKTFRSGETDLRGIFVADHLVGPATVIVKKDEEYAFFRGTGVHQPQHFQPPAQVPGSNAPAMKRTQKAGGDFDALQNNLNLNSVNRARQSQWLQEEVMQRKQQGVEVQKTK